MFVRCEEEEERKTKGGARRWLLCATSPRFFLAPVVVIFLQRNSASGYLAVVSTRTRVQSLHLPTCLLHAFTRCCGELRWHLPAPHVYHPPLSPFLTPYLATPLQDVKTYFCSMSLCYAYAYDTILRSASPPLSLTSLPVLSATCLQQDVCRRLILGYNRWYLSHFHATLFVPICNVISILLTC